MHYQTNFELLCSLCENLCNIKNPKVYGYDGLINEIQNFIQTKDNQVKIEMIIDKYIKK